MSTGLKQVARLRALREAKERVSEARLLVANSKVAAAEVAIDGLLQNRVRLRTAGSEGLCTGDWDEWWMAESADLLSQRAERQLREVREERRQQAMDCEDLFLRDRLAAEQARMLEERRKAEARRLAERSEQASSDDRFAAQAHWRKQKQPVGAAAAP